LNLRADIRECAFCARLSYIITITLCHLSPQPPNTKTHITHEAYVHTARAKNESIHRKIPYIGIHRNP
jgi:hypothetical protein